MIARRFAGALVALAKWPRSVLWNRASAFLTAISRRMAL